MRDVGIVCRRGRIRSQRAIDCRCAPTESLPTIGKVGLLTTDAPPNVHDKSEYENATLQQP